MSAFPLDGIVNVVLLRWLTGQFVRFFDRLVVVTDEELFPGFALHNRQLRHRLVNIELHIVDSVDSLIGLAEEIYLEAIEIGQR